MALTTVVPNAAPQPYSFTNNGFTTDTVGGVNFPLQDGVPYQNNYMFKVIPATASVIINQYGVPESTGKSQGFFIPLPTLDVKNTVAPFETIGKAITYNGQPAFLLDCERCLTFTVNNTDVFNPWHVVLTGYDFLGTPLTITSARTVSGFGVGPLIVPIPICILTNIYVSANPYFDSAEPGPYYVTVSTNNIIGLPYLLDKLSYVNTLAWNNEALAVNTTNIQVGNTWRLTPPLVSGVTVARGTITTPTNPNGLTLLTCNYFVYGSDSEMNSELINLNQSTRNTIPVINNADGNPVVPNLTKYDLVGMQYPGDLSVATLYQTQLDA